MTKIKKYVDQIKEELEGAREYAENYVEQKVRGNNQMASRYKEMANDELKHATYIRELAVSEITDAERVITPPEEMLRRWEDAHAEYVDKSAWIKQMLSM